MTKFKIFLLISISTFFIQSCEDSDNIITVSILDFTTTINEKPNTGSSIGVVSASTNQGSIAFSIIEQTPLQAIQINEITGEITVLTRSLFNFQTYSTLTAIVKATNSEISDTATITINLLEVLDDYNLLAVSDQGEV